MRYPQFYEMYRNAIRNTWTVEEVDFSLGHQGPEGQVRPGRAPPDRAPDRVLRHRRLDRLQQPGAEPVPAHQRARSAHVPVAAAVRGSAARAVLPDPAGHLPAGSERARQGVRCGREHPVDPAQGRVLLQVDRLAAGHHRASRRASSAASSCSTWSASPAASRACSSSAPSPTSTTCVRAGCCTAWPAAPTGCSATRARTWLSPSR